MRKYKLPTLICVMVWMLSCACGDLQSEDVNSISISEKSQQLGESNSELTSTVEGSDRSEKASSLVESLRDYMADDSVDDITIKWNYTDNIRRFWGDGLAISFSSMGCNGRDVEENIFCFLSKYEDAFGIDHRSLSDLRLRIVHSMQSGSRMYRYDQYVDNYIVPGSSVTVIINANGDLTQIVSKFVAGLELELGQYASLDDLSADVDLGDIYNSVTNQTGIDSSRFEPATPMIWVDKHNKSSVGMPAFSILTKSIRPIEIIVSAVDGIVIQVKKIYGEYDASSVIKTQIAYPDVDGTCVWFCASPRTCSSEFSPNKRCVNRCDGDGFGENNGDDECQNDHGDSWQCWEPGDGESTYQYWCYNKLDDPNKDPDVEIYNDGWQISGYQDYPKMDNLQDKVDDLKSYWENRLDRDGLDDDGKDLVATITAHCMEWDECEEEPCEYVYGEGCEDQVAWGASNGIYMHAGAMGAYDDNDPDATQWGLVGHEFGHSIVGNECNNDLLCNNDCLGETLANFNSIYFTVYKTSNDIYWVDERTGLSTGNRDEYGLYYAFRSRFDWLACSSTGGTGDYCVSSNHCNPYEVCDSDAHECYVPHSKYFNLPIWGRFGRILSDGPGVLDVSPYYEDVGYSFSGITLDASEHIFMDSYNMLDQGDYPDDWVDNLIQAGSENGQLDKTRKSLGIAGFITRTINHTYPWNTSTSYAPNEYKFSAWTLSSNKILTAWRESTKNIRVRYHNGYSYYTDTISANAGGGPAIVEYNDKLYIFWTDSTTKNIKFLYYNSNATKSSIYDLGSKDIKSNTSFDAIIFNGDLHIVYDYEDTGKISISKCTTTTCTTSGWYDFDAGAPTVYRKEIPYYATFGTIGVEAGTDLNGVGDPDEEYLYIVSSVLSGATAKYIRIQQLDDSYTQTHSTTIPSYYPSYRTENEIGVKMSESAFPDGNNYLYLAWKGYSSDTLYKAIVQYYDDDDDDDTWITKSDDMYLEGTTGMRIRRGEGVDYQDTTYLHTNDDGYIRYSILYGRY